MVVNDNSCFNIFVQIFLNYLESLYGADAKIGRNGTTIQYRPLQNHINIMNL